MQNRGDVPDDDQTLLPWKEKVDWSLNGTNGVVYKCIPGPRTPRLAKLHVAPTFLVRPQDQKAPIGSQVEFHCSDFSAIGPPVPYIHWLKNGEVIRWKAPESAYSVLVVNVTEDAAGNYTCHSRNSVGISKSRPLDPSLGGFHFMNNGSLIVTDVDADTADNLKLYMCKVRGRRKPSIAFTVELEDELPVVTVQPKEITLIPGDSLQLSCKLRGSPLTTKIEWTKNDQKIIPDEIVQILVASHCIQ
ncbi:unnamed protein product [Strongylus vulgaris]|uniref:Ig-like domain-containing protein n=1 Tax=Strongylus vulgaris TaxID=40348 RepID=A0A3P7IQD8_STRVU|nr:unnamed protein product [Strongylus vulgaris]